MVTRELNVMTPGVNINKSAYQQLVDEPKIFACRFKDAPPGAYIEFIRSRKGRCLGAIQHYASGREDFYPNLPNSPLFNSKKSKEEIEVLDGAGIGVVEKAGKDYLSRGTFTKETPKTFKPGEVPAKPTEEQVAKIIKDIPVVPVNPLPPNTTPAPTGADISKENPPSKLTPANLAAAVATTEVKK